MVEELEKKKKDLIKWLKINGRNCFKNQCHLLKNTTEKIYWSYGYLSAILDILKLIKEEDKK